MTRRADWMQRLHTAVEHARSIPFQYGLHDCVMWAAYCVDQMCDTRFGHQIRSEYGYRGKDDSDAFIAEAGGFEALACRILGPSSPVSTAAPGDVVLARNFDGGEIISIMLGHHLIAPGPAGVFSMPFSAGIVCWKV